MLSRWKEAKLLRRMNRNLTQLLITQRDFCFPNEGVVEAAEIMSRRGLRKVLVINASGEIVGKYTLGASGITLHPPEATDHPEHSVSISIAK
jgi:hypothetical protein